MNSKPDSRFHGKVRVEIGLTTVEVNIFDDNREKVYLEIQQAIAQFSHDIKPATDAQRAIYRAEQAAAANPAPAPAKAAPAPSPAPQARAAAAPSPAPKATNPARTTTTKAANPPMCETCGMSDMVELIAWTDKKSGERKKAWKCQRCGEWIYPERKQTARRFSW